MRFFSSASGKHRLNSLCILEQLGRAWDQALRAYLADLQLAYRMLRDPHFQLD